jgi:glycerol-3-phosphate O-acyltransferase
MDTLRVEEALGGTKNQYHRAMAHGRGEAPIFGFNDHKSGIVHDVVERVTAGVSDPILVLNEAAYFEVRRLAPAGGPEYAEWRALAGTLGRLGETEAREKLRELCERYAWDVAGNFNPTVYKFATRAMAPILGTILSPRAALKNIPNLGSLHALDGRIVVQGPTETIATLAKRGTLVFVPTHLSNLDSVVFGFALERAGLPPATYGAGKNLFSNPVLSFFMHNLGAYRVDRRLKHGLYKDVLKTYSCILIERGYHSLFFPGGTRSRSGGIERRLKLGLAGTAIEAFGRTAEQGKTQPVYFVPATLNYMLTLEAETLIDDFLQEEGKARYIIEDDESTRVGRIAAFAQKLLGLDESVVVRFGDPMDCFGNVVDAEGESFDAHGRRVDAESYLTGDDGKPHRDVSRDTQYTRELGEAICAAFAKETVIMATHVVASAAFDHLRAAVARPADLFAILNHRDSVRISREELTMKVAAILDRAKQLESDHKLVLGPQLAGAKPPQVIDSALRAFAGYHTNPVIAAGATDLVLEDTRLLFYYQNRLAAHGLAFDAIKPHAKLG